MCVCITYMCVCACTTIIKEIEAVNVREKKEYMRRVGEEKRKKQKMQLNFNLKMQTFKIK